MLEIEDDANTELGYPQIVQHQSTFVVGNLVDHFRIHDDGIKRNEVGNEEPYLLSFIEDSRRPVVAETECFSGQTRRPRRFRTAFRLARARAY